MFNSSFTRMLARSLASHPESSTGGYTVDVSPEAMVALSHAASSEHALIRNNEGGNPWVVHRQSGLKIKLLGRFERNTGLFHVIVEESLAWGNDGEYLQDIQATSKGEPLRVLSVAEILESLYGDAESLNEPQSDAADRPTRHTLAS